MDDNTEEATTGVCGVDGRLRWPSEEQYRLLALMGRLETLDDIVDRRWERIQIDASVDERTEPTTGADLKRLREEAGVSIQQLAKWLARRRFTIAGGHELDGWRLSRMERGELQISNHVAKTIKSLIEDELRWRSILNRPHTVKPKAPSTNSVSPTRDPQPRHWNQRAAQDKPRTVKRTPKAPSDSVTPVKAENQQTADDEPRTTEYAPEPLAARRSTVTLRKLFKLVQQQNPDALPLPLGKATVARCVNLFNRFFGGKLAEELSTGDILAYVKQRRENPLPGSDEAVNNDMIHRELTTLRYAYELGFEQGRISVRMPDEFFRIPSDLID